MSTISRTFQNLRKVGIKDYFVQMLQRLIRALLALQQYIGDTKAGTLIGTDRAGNKFFENNEELPLRTRWVEYAKHDYDAAQIEPGWHAWISYSVDKAPTQDALLQTGTRSFEPALPKPNFTMTPGAFKTYNTTKSKLATWEPVAAQRA
ncbi:hypothetical protein ACO1O0_008597 [Amphichorda felina]